MAKFLCVLTEEQARAIHADRRSYTRIAVEYGVSTMTVSNIKRGKTWKRLGLQPTPTHVRKTYSDYVKDKQLSFEDTLNTQAPVNNLVPIVAENS